MAVKTYTREEWKAETRRREAQKRRELDKRIAARNKSVRKAEGPLFFEFFRLLWHFIVHAGMFSSDPVLARQAMVLTAREELQNQRQIAEANWQRDQALQDERDRRMARMIAQELAAEARRARP